MRNIIIIVTFILFVALVANAGAITKPKGKKSDPGVDRDHQMTIINPVDVSGNPVNMQFDWKNARDPFRRVK